MKRNILLVCCAISALTYAQNAIKEDFEANSLEWTEYRAILIALVWKNMYHKLKKDIWRLFPLLQGKLIHQDLCHHMLVECQSPIVLLLWMYKNHL